MEKSCKKGNKHGCYMAGSLYATGMPEEGIKQDRKASERMLRMACDNDVSKACSFLATQFLLGQNGFKPDRTKAHDLMVKACDLHSIESCHNLAVMYKKGDGVPKDPVKADEFIEKFKVATRAEYGKEAPV